MNIEVKRKKGESARSLVRRFTRAVRHSGLLRRAREVKRHRRPLSDSEKKQKTLRGLKIQKERERMRKLGKRL